MLQLSLPFSIESYPTLFLPISLTFVLGHLFQLYLTETFVTLLLFVSPVLNLPCSCPPLCILAGSAFNHSCTSRASFLFAFHTTYFTYCFCLFIYLFIYYLFSFSFLSFFSFPILFISNSTCYCGEVDNNNNNKTEEFFFIIYYLTRLQSQKSKLSVFWRWGCLHSADLRSRHPRTSNAPRGREEIGGRKIHTELQASA